MANSNATQAMNLFGSSSVATQQLNEEAARHEANMKACNGSTSKIQAEMARYNKAIEKIAGQALAVDKDQRLSLTFPFRLTKEVKEKINEDVDYQIRKGIIKPKLTSACSIVSGTPIPAGELYVEVENGQAEVCDFYDAGDDYVIDGVEICIYVNSAK